MHRFRLSQQTPHNRTIAGKRIKADQKSFPVLKGMSLYKLSLEANGIREPHWHPNADELGYCLSGEVMVAFYHTGDEFQRFLVREGEVFLIPSGALHYIENVGRGEAELLLSFSHELPEEFGLPSSVGMFSNAVLGNTWGVKGEHFERLKRPLKDHFALFRKSGRVEQEVHHANLYRFSLEASQPVLEKSGGNARMARQNVWPILKRQALYSLELNGGGMREPHWHPETAEMGYVEEGHGRMSILNPEGKVDTYELEPGDLYFIPKAYPHHIENLGKGRLHFLIFFDQAMPADVGFTGSIRAFSDEVIGAVLGVDQSFFHPLVNYPVDQFIVDKVNPSA